MKLRHREAVHFAQSYNCAWQEWDMNPACWTRDHVHEQLAMLPLLHSLSLCGQRRRLSEPGCEVENRRHMAVTHVGYMGLDVGVSRRRPLSEGWVPGLAAQVLLMEIASSCLQEKATLSALVQTRHGGLCLQALSSGLCSPG